MEGLPGSSSQPLEFHSSEDEQPPQLEERGPCTDEKEEMEGEIRYSNEEEISHHTSGEKQTSAEEGNTEEEEIEGEI